MEVALETGSSECSGAVADDDGQLWRGYKLATVRTRLEEAGSLTPVEVGPIQTHDHKRCGRLLARRPVRRGSDRLLMDRRLLDGATITPLKRQQAVDVIVPLRHDMLSYQEAVLAEVARRWPAHPTRPDQQIAGVRGVEPVWDECHVTLNACVIRVYNQKQQALDDIVLVTTDLSLSAVWIVKHDEQRPAREQDDEQLKRGGGRLNKLSSTRYRQIVCYLLTLVPATACTNSWPTPRPARAVPTSRGRPSPLSR